MTTHARDTAEAHALTVIHAVVRGGQGGCERNRRYACTTQPLLLFFLSLSLSHGTPMQSRTCKHMHGCSCLCVAPLFCLQSPNMGVSPQRRKGKNESLSKIKNMYSPSSGARRHAPQPPENASTVSSLLLSTPRFRFVLPAKRCITAPARRRRSTHARTPHRTTHEHEEHPQQVGETCAWVRVTF